MQHSSIPHRLQVLAVWAIASLIGLLIFNLGGLDTPQTYWSAAKPSYLQHVAFWDSEWYYRVATQGYPDSTSLPIGQDGRVGQNTWAFMPIYAYLSGGLAKLLSANYYACAVVVAWLGSALAALGLDAWMRPRVGKAASLLGVTIFFTCGPAIILQLPYAESLGLALVAIGFAVLAKRRFAWAMVVFVLAAFTRPIGVPLGAALGLWWVWEELRARGLISASRFDASFSSARVYADADPYAANYDAATASNAPAPAPTPPALPSFTPMDLSPLPLSSKDRLWLFVTAAVTCAAALTWPLLAWIATGRMSAYVDTETAWRGVDLAPFEAWINRSASFGGAHAGVIGLFGVLALSLCVLSWPQLRQLGRLTWMWCVCYWVYLLIFFDPSSSILRMLLMMAPLAWVLGAKLSNHLRAAVALIALSIVSQVLWIAWIWDAYSLSLSKIYWMP